MSITPPQAASQPNFRRLGLFAPFLLAAAVLIAYSNTPGNAFAFDDSHCIEQNPWIRSLANVPRFFVDANTSTPLWSNRDYRPILVTSFAINYAVSGPTTSASHFDAWHWTNIAIHIANAWAVFLLGRRLLGTRSMAPVRGLPPALGDVAALGAALLFCVHPVTSACVNYISSRSSSLTATFVLFSLVNYLAGLSGPSPFRSLIASWALLVLGVLTKVEGVALIGAIVLAELLLSPAHRDTPLLHRLKDRAMYLRLAPFLVTGVALVILWRFKTGLVNPTRGGVSNTPLDYLATEFRAWWYYVGKIFVPTHLIADYPTFPRTTWSDLVQLRDWVTLGALLAWGLLVTCAIAFARRAPVPVFLFLCFFVLLAPHSSVIPLAEPVNEHRPYLADTMFFLLFSAGACIGVSQVTRRPLVPAAVLGLVLAAPLTLLTHQRNLVWRDMLTLWGDTVAKVPDSPRAHANYGLALAAAKRFPEAIGQYREALRISPGFMYTQTHLADALAQVGDTLGAMAAHDQSVLDSPSYEEPYYARGVFRAQLRDVAGAAADMEKAHRLSTAPFKATAALAECWLRLGKTSEAQRLIARGRTLDPAEFERLRVEFRGLLGSPDPIEQVGDGFAWMAKDHLIEAQGCFREALRLDPACFPAKIGIGLVCDKQGQVAEAVRWLDRAVSEHRDREEPLHFRGVFRAGRGEWGAALQDFRAALDLGASPIRETAAIGETLVAMGKPEEAEALFAKVKIAELSDLDRERAEFRATISRRR